MNHSGAPLKTAPPTIRACGESPSSFTLAAEPTSKAAAPSLMLDALPAVTVPSGLKTGFKARSFTSSNFAGPSSIENVAVLPRQATSTGTISSSEKPRMTASRACVWLRTAKSSCTCLVKPNFTAHWSAKLPMCLFVNGSVRPSRIIESSTSQWPMRKPSRALGSR